MKFKILFHLEAEIEFGESYSWYNEQSDGLGEKFRNAINAVISNIYEHPQHYSKKRFNFREAVVAIFPFVVVYEIIENRNLIHIASIFHTSRNPKLKYRKFKP
jgi:hypothetical protein